MRLLLPLLLTVAVGLTACNKPKDQQIPKNNKPVTRGSTPESAKARESEAPSQDKTRDVVQGRRNLEPEETGCTLSLSGDAFLLDCRFDECPVSYLGALTTADSVHLNRAGSSWILEAKRDDPPLKPERNFINVRRRNAELILPGMANGNCKFGTPTKERFQSDPSIQVTGIQIRRSF